METDLKPNDVAIILRPHIEDNIWDGYFEIMVSGFGPITLSKEDMDSLLGVATVLAAVVPFMQSDEENSKLLYDFAKEYYGEEVMNFDYDLEHDSFKDDDDTINLLTVKTIGGMH